MSRGTQSHFRYALLVLLAPITAACTLTATDAKEFEVSEATLSVNFCPEVHPSNAPGENELAETCPLAPEQLVGIPNVTRAGYWNNLFGASSNDGTHEGLRANGSQQLPVRIQWTADSVWAPGTSRLPISQEPEFPTTSDGQMMHHFVQGTPDLRIEVSGLPQHSFAAKGYDVYVYTPTDSAPVQRRTGRYTLTPTEGEKQVRYVEYRKLVEYVRHQEDADPVVHDELLYQEAPVLADEDDPRFNDPAGAAGPQLFAPRIVGVGNYVRFHNIQASGFTLEAVGLTSFGSLQESDTNLRSTVAGIQIVLPEGAPPEPAKRPDLTSCETAKLEANAVLDDFEDGKTRSWLFPEGVSGQVEEHPTQGKALHITGSLHDQASRNISRTLGDPLDARAYSGLAFRAWAGSDSALKRWTIGFPDGSTWITSDVCGQIPDVEQVACFDDFETTFSLEPEVVEHRIDFLRDLEQDGFGYQAPNLDARELYRILLSAASGSMSDSVDLWIDDLTWLSCP